MRNIVFILLVLMITSCKKDELENQINYSYINETLKSNFSFDEGSYWVYQDQAMNIDSIVLINHETGFTSTCPGACSRNEFIELTFENLTQRTSFNHYLLSDFTRYNGGGSWGQNGQPIYILDRDEEYEFNGLTVGERLDSLMILNTIFYNLEKMSVHADMQYQNEFEFDRDFYFVPSVGIVREVIYDTINGTKIWDLKNYYIE
tara:strand:+ start:63 stop:674 length:612 start_codon:yes stop_codon:yes gene_type:complete